MNDWVEIQGRGGGGAKEINNNKKSQWEAKTGVKTRLKDNAVFVKVYLLYLRHICEIFVLSVRDSNDHALLF